MINGIPVIGSNRGGIPETLGDGRDLGGFAGSAASRGQALFPVFDDVAPGRFRVFFVQEPLWLV